MDAIETVKGSKEVLLSTGELKEAALYGDREMTVTKTDNSTETVKVRQLLVKHFPEFIKLIEDEPKQVEFYCGKPDGWSDSLTVNSFEEVLKTGDEMNKDFFERWVQRRLARQEQVMPGMSERLQNQIISSLTSVPKLPSSPGIQGRRS